MVDAHCVVPPWRTGLGRRGHQAPADEGHGLWVSRHQAREPLAPVVSDQASAKASTMTSPRPDSACSSGAVGEAGAGREQPPSVTVISTSRPPLARLLRSTHRTNGGLPETKAFVASSDPIRRAS